MNENTLGVVSIHRKTGQIDEVSSCHHTYELVNLCCVIESRVSCDPLSALVFEVTYQRVCFYIM